LPRKRNPRTSGPAPPPSPPPAASSTAPDPKTALPIVDAPPEWASDGSEAAHRQATLRWGHLLEGGPAVGSLWRDRAGTRYVLLTLSLAPPGMRAWVTVLPEGCGSGPLLSYPLDEFCAFCRLESGAFAYRFQRVLAAADLVAPPREKKS
jgi:hypothetical protein